MTTGRIVVVKEYNEPFTIEGIRQLEDANDKLSQLERPFHPTCLVRLRQLSLRYRAPLPAMAVRGPRA